MFTTLTLINSRRLFPKIVSEVCEYKGFTYYSSKLLSHRENNQKFINKFKKRSGIPVIETDSPLVFKYKMILLTNTVMLLPYKNVGVCDKDGSLAFLLPFMSQNSGVISIFTENAAAYSDITNEILSVYGTPTIISEKISNILKCDVVFAVKPPKSISKNNNVFTLKSTEGREPLLPFSLPDYADTLSVAAGLFYYGGFREFGKLTFK